MNDEKRVRRPTHQQLLDLKGWVRRVKPVTTWDDLTYPQRIVTGIKTIYSAFTPGRSQLCLFAGVSGTGKTMAAEVVASDLRLDLYRIDLSRVVSKYVGETEKNLSRIFKKQEPVVRQLLRRGERNDISTEKGQPGTGCDFTAEAADESRLSRRYQR